MLSNIEISKELLSEVLNEEVLSIRPYIDNDPFYKNVFMWECRKNTYDTINIYELAHKCKEWLKSNVSNANSGFDNGHRNFCHIENYNIQDRFYADTEVEAIFKACEWILKEINAK